MEANQSVLLRAACPKPGDQAEAARRCGISPAFLNQMINGRRGVPIAMGATIERVLGVSRRDLFPDQWQTIWPELASEADRACQDMRHPLQSQEVEK